MTALELQEEMQARGFAMSLEMAENALALASDPSLERMSDYYARIRRATLFHRFDTYICTCEMLAVAIVAAESEAP